MKYMFAVFLLIVTSGLVFMASVRDSSIHPDCPKLIKDSQEVLEDVIKYESKNVELVVKAAIIRGQIKQFCQEK